MIGTSQRALFIVAPRSKSANKCCYVCNQPDHLAKSCKANNREQESRGCTTHKQDPNKSNARQITTESDEDQHDTDGENSLDPLSWLYTDSEGTVDTVRVSDKGSRPQYVNIQVQGVPTTGVIDTGADITIMGGNLFKKVAAAARLRKKDFKKPDRVSRTYDKRQFKLHGRMDLEISFNVKVLHTPKMDAHNQLLLAEGVCSQLGIVEYHEDVWPGRKLDMGTEEAQQELQSKDTPVLSVKQLHMLREMISAFIPQLKSCITSMFFEKNLYIAWFTIELAYLPLDDYPIY